MTGEQLRPENDVNRRGELLPAYTIWTLSVLLGMTSLALFGAFIFTGLPSHMNFGLTDELSLSINTLLCMIFFLQHSLMVRKGFRKWGSEYLPLNYHGALFSIFSGAALLVLMLFWQKTSIFRVDLDGALFWVMRSVFFLAITGLYYTSRAFRSFDPFGIRDISIHLKGRIKRRPAFMVRGSYRWIRHPLYFFCLLIIWTPVCLTADRLLFMGLWTMWIVIGTILEESDLISKFGDAYRDYQNAVPMLIPYKGFPREYHA